MATVITYEGSSSVTTTVYTCPASTVAKVIFNCGGADGTSAVGNFASAGGQNSASGTITAGGARVLRANGSANVTGQSYMGASIAQDKGTTNTWLTAPISANQTHITNGTSASDNIGAIGEKVFYLTAGETVVLTEVGTSTFHYSFTVFEEAV